MAKNFSIPLAALASQVLILENTLSKNFSAKDCEAGVELAVFEAMVARLRSSSFMDFTRTEVMPVRLIVCALPSSLNAASCGLVEAISSAMKPQ